MHAKNAVLARPMRRLTSLGACGVPGVPDRSISRMIAINRLLASNSRPRRWSFSCRVAALASRAILIREAFRDGDSCARDHMSPRRSAITPATGNMKLPASPRATVNWRQNFGVELSNCFTSGHLDSRVRHWTHCSRSLSFVVKNDGRSRLLLGVRIDANGLVCDGRNGCGNCCWYRYPVGLCQAGRGRSCMPCDCKSPHIGNKKHRIAPPTVRCPD